MTSTTSVISKPGNGCISSSDLYSRWISPSETLIIKYSSGMLQEISSEAIAGALPLKHNNPQQCPYGLYAEQYSGECFTRPRLKNHRNYVYRCLPSAKHSPFKSLPKEGKDLISDFSNMIITPAQLRMNPLPIPTQKPVQFWQSFRTFCGAGSPQMKKGVGIHVYTCNESMIDTAMVNADGELLIVPQKGNIFVRTEYGPMEVPVGYICVIQRGIAFQVYVHGPSRGYIADLYEGRFVLPDLGLIGANNGLANVHHFQSVLASYDDQPLSHSFRIIQKFGGKLFCAERPSTIFDVVAFHGNAIPYRYNLADFCVVNSVSYDHIDPSVFTVLTAKTNIEGVAACDFVIFPPRFIVQKDTFRPPYYHKNMCSEAMGNIRGKYEAKPTGFLPGGFSLHSCMTPHGPDANTFEKASVAELKPVFPKNDALAFMFESYYMFKVTPLALSDILQKDYNECWDGLKMNFSKSKL